METKINTDPRCYRLGQRFSNVQGRSSTWRANEKCYFAFSASRDSDAVFSDVGFDDLNFLNMKIVNVLDPGCLQTILNETPEGKN